MSKNMKNTNENNGYKPMDENVKARGQVRDSKGESTKDGTENGYNKASNSTGKSGRSSER